VRYWTDGVEGGEEFSDSLSLSLVRNDRLRNPVRNCGRRRSAPISVVRSFQRHGRVDERFSRRLSNFDVGCSKRAKGGPIGPLFVANYHFFIYIVVSAIYRNHLPRHNPPAIERSLFVRFLNFFFYVPIYFRENKRRPPIARKSLNGFPDGGCIKQETKITAVYIYIRRHYRRG